MDLPDDLTWIKGKHTVKAGANARYIDQYSYDYTGVYQDATLGTGNGNAPPASVSPPNISFSGPDTFQNLYNNLLGRVAQVTPRPSIAT